MAISKVSFFKTPQAGDDEYYWTEDTLQQDTAVYINSTHLMLDVMANDLGGNAKKLYSIDDGNGNTIDPTDLLNADALVGGISAWEPTADGNRARINNGKIEFDLSNELPGGVNSLGAGDQFTDTFIYAIRLANGTLSWAHVQITIDGVNDSATIKASDHEDTSVVEAGGIANGTGGDPDASGQLTVTDPDAGQSKFKVPASLDGTYGSFTFDELTGAWTYTLNQGKADKLVDGEAATDTLKVTSFDGTASYDITVDITGKNDNAAIIVDGTPDTEVTEAGGAANATPGDPDASGKLLVSDVDAGEDKFKVPASLDGTYGTFTFDENTGDWTYALDQGKADKLTDGEPATDTLKVESFDGTASYDITVDITGSNDDAVITASDDEDTSVTEDGGIANADKGDPDASGKLTVSDADAGESLFQAPGSLDGTYGTFAFDETTGEWSYTLNQAKADELFGGEAASDKLTVTSLDGTDSYEIVVDITGANDAPVADDETDSTDEDTTFTVNAAGGVLTGDVDVDGDSLSVTAFTVAGDATIYTAGDTATITGIGALTINANGSYTFVPAANFNGAVPVATYTVSDGVLTDTGTLTLTVDAVNDAPVASGGATLAAINEDPISPPGATIASLFGGNFSDAADQVAGGSSADTFAGIAISGYTADAGKGAWQYSTNGGGSWLALGNATTVTAITLDASAMLRFVPAANYNGAATALSANLIESGLAIVNGATIDLTGATGDETHISSGTVALSHTINPVNDAPALDLDANNSAAAGANYAATFTENGSAVAVVDADVSITDVDDSNIESATITLTNTKAGDSLTVVGALPAGISIDPASTTTQIILTGSASLAAYQTALQLLRFSNSSENPDTTPRDVTVVVNDGDANSNTAHATVTVVAVNDAPVLDLDADNSSTATGANYKTTFTENGSAVAIADADTSISDVDDANIESATVTLTNPKTDDLLSVSNLAALALLGIAVDGASTTSQIILTGSASLASYQAALQLVVFSNSSEDPDTTDRTVTVVVNDGAANSNTATTTITVVAVADNAPPVATDDVWIISQSTAAVLPSLAVLANDTDPDGDRLTVSAVSGATLNADGTISLTTGTTGGSFTYTVVDGHGGSDTATVTYSVVNAAPSGFDLTAFTYDASYLDAAGGADTLTGAGGIDVLYGGTGNNIDNLIGGNGSDILRGGQANDVIDGGGGIDLIDFSDGAAGIAFTLTQSSSNTSTGALGVSLGTDTYKNIEGVIGTNSADNLTGSGSDDVIHGGGGNDTIDGAGGNDIIYGGAGADSMTGGADRDTFLYKDIAEGGAAETITGFTKGAAGDVLDLHDLLVDFAPGYDGTNAFTGGYVTFDISSGTNTVVKIDADGSAGVGAAVTLVTLTSVLVTSADTDNYAV